MDRASRLGAGDALEHVFHEGAAVAGPFFVWKSLPNTLGHPRWAFAVGKRLAPLATTRNATRRRLRAAADAAGIALAADIAVIARGPALNATVADLRDALIATARRATARRRQ